MHSLVPICVKTGGLIHNKLWISGWPSLSQVFLRFTSSLQKNGAIFVSLCDKKHELRWTNLPYLTQSRFQCLEFDSFFPLRYGLTTKLKKLMLQTIHKGEYVGCFTFSSFLFRPFKEFWDSTSPFIRLQWSQHIHEAHMGNPCIIWNL
jgi:hypothetical protein